jgi:hypothetical protein
MLRAALAAPLLLLAAIVLAAFAESTVASSPRESDSFPCAGHACACQDAVSCRAACCCHASEPHAANEDEPARFESFEARASSSVASEGPASDVHALARRARCDGGRAKVASSAPSGPASHVRACERANVAVERRAPFARIETALEGRAPSPAAPPPKPIES